MTKGQKILKLLNYTASEFEDRMMKDYLQWCMDKSYVAKDVEQVGAGTLMHLELNLNDLQSLMADTKLCNYFKKMYADCMLDFLEDVEGMNPEPNQEEARAVYKNCILNCFRFYSIPLLNQARNKKIVNYVN